MIETLQARLPLKNPTEMTKDYQDTGKLHHSGSQETVPFEESV